jgi:transcriptional antiterminator RfaH
MPQLKQCARNRSRHLGDTNWFAIQTKPCREELASGYISHLGLEVFLPRAMLVGALRDGRPWAQKPLFPGYLFARFCPANYLHLVQYARGVRRVVCAGGWPLPVDEEIISVIRDRVSAQQVPETKSSNLRLGEEIVVRDGVLKGLCGIFEQRISNRGRVLLLLDAIHYQARVLIDSRSLKPAAQAI